MKNIAVLISGSGSNLQSLMDSQVSGGLKGCIRLVVADNEESYGLIRAREGGIPTEVATKEVFFSNPNLVLELLERNEIDIIVLAGFLTRVPEVIVRAYERRIVNIHPSLLPKYGGKGFYGDMIHKSVLRDGDAFSGATVHFVDTGIDTGEVIVQSSVAVSKDDTLESLRDKVRNVEHMILTEAVNKICEEE
jgi:phosphoribosylglycinamide formyltransferase 1